MLTLICVKYRYGILILKCLFFVCFVFVFLQTRKNKKGLSLDNYLWKYIMRYNVHYECLFNTLYISNWMWPKEAKFIILFIRTFVRMYHPKQSVTHLCVVCLVIRHGPRSWSFLSGFSFISGFGECTLSLCKLTLLTAYLLLEATQHIPSADRGLELCLGGWNIDFKQTFNSKCTNAFC